MRAADLAPLVYSRPKELVPLRYQNTHFTAVQCSCVGLEQNREILFTAKQCQNKAL